MESVTTLGRGTAWLGSARLFAVLLVLNLLATVAIVAVGLHSTTPDDGNTWLGLADGLRHGRYSFWYFLPDYVPDTFRNPGYPLFLAGLRILGAGKNAIVGVQVGLYLAAIGLLLRLAGRCEGARPSWLVRNLFLLLLLPNVQLVYLAAYIYPEVLVAFLMVAYGVVALTWQPGTWRRALVLALLAGFIFQVRPVFIFFPLVLLALDFWQTRQARPRTAFAWGQAAGLLALFGLTMLPYALWNYRHHGVLKATSIEGGAGVMQIGFWALRMPGYQEGRYWGNTMGDEVVSFTDSAAVPGHIAAFNHEWDVIEAQCQPLLTAQDRRSLARMRTALDSLPPEKATGLYPTQSSAYTRRREALLMQANLADIRREPGYYLRTRLYTLVRLWVTGVQRPAWRAAGTPLAKIKVLYPALVSGATLLLALLSFGWAGRHWRTAFDNNLAARTWWLALALVVYFGLIHLPFAIQARYTVPVRPWLLLGMALAVAVWLRRARRAPAGAAPTPALASNPNPATSR